LTINAVKCTTNKCGNFYKLIEHKKAWQKLSSCYDAYVQHRPPTPTSIKFEIT